MDFSNARWGYLCRHLLHGIDCDWSGILLMIQHQQSISSSVEYPSIFLEQKMGGWYRSGLREISKVVVQSQSLAKISTYQFMANVTVAGSNARLISENFLSKDIIKNKA